MSQNIVGKLKTDGKWLPRLLGQGLWENSPRRRKKHADAERHEKLTAAQTEQDVRGIQTHLMEYRDGNLNSVLDEASTHLRGKEFSHPSQEWLSRFCAGAEHIADADVQSAWARLLAGECESPGSFSKHAISALSNMSRKDVLEFTSLSTCVWNEGRGPMVVYFRDRREARGTNRIVPVTIPLLERAGLISALPTNSDQVARFPNLTSTLGVAPDTCPSMSISYFGESYTLDASTPEPAWSLGYVSLTPTGLELLPLCQSERNKEYFEHCLAVWSAEGWRLRANESRES